MKQFERSRDTCRNTLSRKIVKYLEQMITFIYRETTEVQHRIRCAWSAFARHRQDLTSKSCLYRHSLLLFDAVVTPTNMYVAGTWTATKQHETCSAQPCEEGLVSSIRRRENMKKQKTEDDSANDEGTRKAMFLDAEGTSSQEEELEDWTEYIKRSTREDDETMLTNNIPNQVEAQKKLKWRQAMRVAVQNQEKWTPRAAEWNPWLIISTRTRRKAGRPAKRCEDDLNEFVKDEETEAAHRNDLQNNNTSVLRRRSLDGKRKTIREACSPWLKNPT